MVAGKNVFCFDYIHSFTQICKNVFKQFLWYKNETKKKPFLVEFSRVVDAGGFWYPNLSKLFLELVSSKKKTQRKKCKQ